MSLCRAIGVFLANIAADQHRIWSFPGKAIRGEGRIPALAIAGATVALIGLDPISTPWLQQDAFQKKPAIRGINFVLSGTNTGRAIAAILLSARLIGLLGAPRLSRTALLAGEAVANAEIIAIGMKYLDRRMRPIEVGPSGNFARTWFRTKSRALDGPGCFPSGHTAASFAAATVFADEYRNRPWVARIAYGLAGIIGLSRLIQRAHFPSDVFFGASVGYSVGHWIVGRRALLPAMGLDVHSRHRGSTVWQ